MKIKKRDGNIVDFDNSKVREAMWKAVRSVEGEDSQILDNLVEQVLTILEKEYTTRKVPTVEDVSDVIEKVLIENGHSKTAKAFIIYRKKRQEIRESKLALGVEDDMKLSFDSLNLISQYKLLQLQDNVQETTSAMFRRVAKVLARVERKFETDQSAVEQEFTKSLLSLDLIPSIAILKNAGSSNQLSDGFVLPVQDDVSAIFDTLKRAALMHKERQKGFGLGFSFTTLRSKGTQVGSLGFGAAGPVSYLQLFDEALYRINPYGTNMAFLSVHHPDIIDFVTSKENVSFRSFGTAVLFTRKFMKAVDDDKTYDLIEPSTGKTVSSVRARSVFDMIATIAWRTGDPAIFFEDNMNKPSVNIFPERVSAATPTGEQPLFDYEGCFSASINLSNHFNDGSIDYDRLKSNVHVGVRMLDNAIDACAYSSAYYKNAVEFTRRIALGITGLADLLIMLKVPYNSLDALKVAEDIMKFVSAEAEAASANLAKERGTFKGYDQTKLQNMLRNSARTTLVHSGIRSVIAGCSQGVEPYYAISYLKRTATSESVEVIPIFEKIAKREGFYSASLMKQVALAGSVRNIREVPEEWRKIFVTVHDCTITDHLNMQAALQKHTDNGVSKTINFPTTSTITEIEQVFRQAHELGCRSVHIYREGSGVQPLLRSKIPKRKRKRGV